MKEKEIEKLLMLLKDNKLEDLKNILTQELLKCTDKTKANLFKVVGKYLKNADEFRPILRTIQHKNGKQFIIDGFSAYIFDTYVKELEELPNSNEELCMNIDAILDKTTRYNNISEEDLMLLKNIKKYISYYKTQDIYKTDDKKKSVIIYFNNKMFDAKMLETTADILGNDLEGCVQINETDWFKSTQIKTQNITAIILPLRVSEDCIKTTKEFTEKFLRNLMGE